MESAGRKIPRAGEDVESRSPSAGAIFPAALCVAAAMMHLWMMPQHMAVWWGYGVLFLIIAVSQGAIGIALLRFASDTLCVVGISVNLGVAGLYVVTTTSGEFFGPHAGKIEGLSALDVAVTAAGFGAVIALVAVLGETWRRWTVNALLLAGAALWLSRAMEILP